MNDWWTEVVECPACPEGHERGIFHSIGMVCARCNKHTGNNSQGHYWGLCKRLMAQGVKINDAVIEPHFCCPDDCELVNART